MLAHVRASDYHADVVQADENCHPFSFEGSPWIIAHNGALPNWRLLQRELLTYCKDEFLKQMKGTSDTEFLFVLLLSLLEGNSDEEVKKGFERMLEVTVEAMASLDLPALTKLKIALVTPDRILGVNYGCGHKGETDPDGDWKELRPSAPGKDDIALSMLLEPMYLLTGKNFQEYADSYQVESCPAGEATSAIFASEPLTEDKDDWLKIEFGEFVALKKTAGKISQEVSRLNV